MAKRRVEISIPEEFRNRLPRPWLRKAVLQTLDAALPNQPCQMSLAFCDDATIQRLNREYRGVAHGVLHLLGYDHQEPKDKALMWGLQDKVLTRLFPEGAAHLSTGSG